MVDACIRIQFFVTCMGCLLCASGVSNSSAWTLLVGSIIPCWEYSSVSCLCTSLWSDCQRLTSSFPKSSEFWLNHSVCHLSHIFDMRFTCHRSDMYYCCVGYCSISWYHTCNLLHSFANLPCHKYRHPIWFCWRISQCISLGYWLGSGRAGWPSPFNHWWDDTLISSRWRWGGEVVESWQYLSISSMNLFLQLYFGAICSNPWHHDIRVLYSELECQILQYSLRVLEYRTLTWSTSRR